MALISHEKLEVLFSTDETEMARYRLEIEIPAAYSKDRRRKSIQAMKQHANFNGFRKGTIPPFIMKDMPSFVLRDTSSDLIQDAIKELKLSPIEGDAAEPDLDEQDMLKRFKVGEDFSFTCEIQLRKLKDADSDELPAPVVTMDAEDMTEDMTIDSFVAPEDSTADAIP